MQVTQAQQLSKAQRRTQALAEFMQELAVADNLFWEVTHKRMSRKKRRQALLDLANTPGVSDMTRARALDNAMIV